MKCRICHRELKREPYRSMGIGKICASKTSKQHELKMDMSDDEIVPYDGGDIFIERLASPTLNLSQPLVNAPDYITLQKHTASGVRTNVPRREVKHSPTGYNFGYGGSGPADFALNVMLMFCADRDGAHFLYQTFKSEFLATKEAANTERLVIPKSEIIGFIERNNIQVNPKMRS